MVIETFDSNSRQTGVRQQINADRQNLSIARPYLPSSLLEYLTLSPDNSKPHIDPVEGSMLFADISGFTKMTEMLAEVGKEGAEWLTNIINSYFDSMLTIAHENGGISINFGGDALLILFKGSDHAYRGVATAQKMLRATKKLKAFQVGKYKVSLEMTVGVNSGTFLFATAGVPESRMQYMVLGSEASRLVEAEAAATNGELLVTSKTLKLVEDCSESESRGDVHKITKLSKRNIKHENSELLDISDSLINDILPYTSPLVAGALRSGKDKVKIEGDHRKVVTMFISILGTNELQEKDGARGLLNEVQQYLSEVIRLADKYGGFVVSNDINVDGLKLITIFGAPVAREEDPSNALRLAIELSEEFLKLNLSLKHHIGVDSGFVYSGDIGPFYRKQYSVMGDSVNLAARLMGSSPENKILISKRIADEAGPGFIVGKRQAILVKGKKEPIEVCELTGVDTSYAVEIDTTGTLFGREGELGQLLGLSIEVESGHGRSVTISGEAGIGKSRLTGEFQNKLEEKNWRILNGACFSHTLRKPFSFWINILETFFNISSDDSPEDRTKKVADRIEKMRPQLVDMSPLLNPLLDIAIPGNKVVRSLSDEARRSRLFELIVALFDTDDAPSPLLLMIEDIHWADSISIKLLNYFAERISTNKIMICLTTRPADEPLLRLPSDMITHIDLTELTSEASLELINKVLDQHKIPSQAIEAILLKAKGNPLFLEEVATSLSQTKLMGNFEPKSSMQLAEDMASLDIPDKLQGLIMSRIDGLSEGSRDALKAASVIGTNFNNTTLNSIIDITPSEASIDSRIKELTDLNLLLPDRQAPMGSYKFRHALIQEVAYESLLFAKRRKLHNRITSHIEDRYADKLEPHFEILVHHSSLGKEYVKTRTYAVKAGDKARKVFAHEDAIDYYIRGSDAVKENGMEGTSLRSCFSERVGDCYELSGHHNDAVLSYKKSLAEWRKNVRNDDKLPPIPDDFDDGTCPSVREALLCHKVGASYEGTHSDYDLSLKWLESALDLLPDKQPLQAAKTSIAKSVALFRKGSYSDAIDWGKKGLELALKSKDKALIAFAQDKLANSYLEQGDLKEAIHHDDEAVLLYRELEDLPGQAITNINLGTCYQLLGVMDEALFYYEFGLKTSKKIGNVTLTAIANNNLGEIHLVQGRIEKAIDHFQEVIDMHNDTGETLALAGLSMVNLSRSYQQKEEYETSSSHLKKGITLLRKVGARGLLTEAHIQQAELQLRMGNDDLSLRTCKLALKDTVELGMKLLESRVLIVRGQIMMGQDNYDAAVMDLTEGAAIAERIDADYEHGLALLYLAELYSMYLNEKTSSEYKFKLALNKATAIFERMGAAKILSKAQNLKGAFDSLLPLV